MITCRNRSSGEEDLKRAGTLLLLVEGGEDTGGGALQSPQSHSLHALVVGVLLEEGGSAAEDPSRAED